MRAEGVIAAVFLARRSQVSLVIRTFSAAIPAFSPRPSFPRKRESKRVADAVNRRLSFLTPLSSLLKQRRLAPQRVKILLASDPHFAALEKFLFPDGDYPLDAVYAEVASLERRLPMRGRRRHH